ncbi:MAG: amidohydrolase [Chloroflexi bacterium]|nr:amidohydrolase [Chloroflexota bacterium]
MTLPDLAIFDADGHVFESDLAIFEHLEPPFTGRRELLRESFFPGLDGWHRAARAISNAHLRGHAAEQHLRSAGELLEDDVSAERWVKVLDQVGIAGAVLYPTHGLAFGKITDREWSIGLAKGYNTWLYRTFTARASRLFGVALLPVLSPDAASSELMRAVKELGFVGGILPGAGPKRPYGDPFYAPIYAAAQELDVPLIVHAGIAEGMGLDIFERACEARALSHPTGQILQLTSMMFHGVFDEFPRLRVAFAEASVAWIPYLAERMALAYKHWAIEMPELKRPPIDHLRGGNLFFHCELEDSTVPQVVALIGDQMLFYASDFPHEPAGHVQEGVEEFSRRHDLSATTKRRVRGENARRLYRLPC